MFQVNEGPTLPVEGLFLEEVPEVLGGVADRAVDGDVGIKLGLGNADLRALGGCLPFGTADIGPAAEQVRRDADGHFRRRRGNRPRTEPGLQVLGRNAQQDAQLIRGLAQGNFQLRDAGLGLLQRAPRLVHVELADDADLQLSFDDLQRLALQGDVLLGVLDSLLGRAIRHIIRRHVAQERDQHVVVVLDRGIQGGGIGFDGPPQAAPEVESPN